ncbi:hypothetical protein DS901_04890 [Loktanella sp. D2R18]|nr:hypothetical protein DS901_04890 [Loktanella sp. D2R18]
MENKMNWSKRSAPGTVDENWARLESFLNRLNALDASSTKIVEGKNDKGEVVTTVIFPVRTIPASDVEFGD